LSSANAVCGQISARCGHDDSYFGAQAAVIGELAPRRSGIEVPRLLPYSAAMRRVEPSVPISCRT
jgi:hypothetical protein